MGKRPVLPKLPQPGVIEDGKQQRPSNAARGSILTEDEYLSAASALLNRVEDDLEDNGKMQDLSSALERLLLARYDSPLPLYWTLVAVEKSLWLDRTSKDPLEFGTGILNFASRAVQTLKSLSALNTSGRTALSAMAPVVGLLYDVASLLNSTVGSLDENSGNVGGSQKKTRKLVRKLKELIRKLLSFTSVCHYKDSEAFGRSFSLPLAPKVPLENFPDFLYPPFPLASKKANFLSKDLSNSAVLADIVFGEVVILQLVVETLDRRILLKKQNVKFSVGHDEYILKLKSLAVHSVWAARSSSPSEMLLDLLLEKRLPVQDLLAAKEEILVRGVLFELVLIDAPFSGGESISPTSGLDHTSVVFLKKLAVARRAVAFFRSQEELSRLATLETRMKALRIPPQLLKWLKSQEKQRLPIIALQDQQALINWLVNTAKKSVFTAILEKSVATWSSGLTSVGTDKHVEVLEVENSDAHSDGEGEDLFFVDTAGETEAAIDLEAADLDFTEAAKGMQGEGDKIKKTRKKRNKKQSKVLFHRHEQASAGSKRSRIELDDVHLTSSSGSDSEDRKGNRSKPAKKKVKKSKHKEVDVRASSEEDEDDDNDIALASAQLSRQENSSPVTSGDVSDQRQAERYPPQRTEELAGRVGTEEPVLLSVEKSAKKKSKDPEDPDLEATSELYPPERTEELADGVGTEEPVHLSVGKSAKKKKPKDPQDPHMEAPSELYLPERTEELADGVGTQEPVLLSVGKSAKKKKKSKDPQGPDTEAPSELYPPERTEELADGVGTQEPVLLSVEKSAKKKSKDPEDPDMKPPSKLYPPQRNEELTGGVGTEEPVLVSVEKSAKKKKKKPKDPEDPDLEPPSELYPPEKTEELAGGVGTEDLTGGVGTEEPILLSVEKYSKKKKKSKDPEDPDMEAASELNPPQGTEELADGAGTEESVLLSVEKSTKKKKKKFKDPEDPDVEPPSELYPPQRTEGLGGGLGTEELTGGVGTGELTDGIGTEEPVLLSAEESAQKKSKDPEDPDMEPPSELYPPERTEELAGGVGTEELTGGVGTEEPVLLSVEKYSKKKSKDRENPGVEPPRELYPPQRNEELAGGVRTEELTGGVGTEEPVLLSVEKSAKKKKSKNPEDPDMEPPSELYPPERTEELAGGVGTEELTGGVGTEEPVLLSVEKYSKKKSKDRENPGVEAVAEDEGRSKDGFLCTSTPKNKLVSGDPEADTEDKGDAHTEENIVISTTIQDVETRADVQGEEAEDLAQKERTTSFEEMEMKRPSSPPSTLTPQHEGGDDLGGILDVAGVVQRASLRNVQEEIRVVKSSKKKRMKEHPREGAEDDQHQIFDTIKKELVTASGNFSSADLIDALQVGDSLPVDQHLSSRTKTIRNKRARLGDEGNSTGDIEGAMTRESAVTVSAAISDNTRSANETTTDGKVSQGDVSLTEEEALLSASLMKEILGNRQTTVSDGCTRDESEKNISTPVATQVNLPLTSVISGAADGAQETARPLVKPTEPPMKNVVEETELGTDSTPFKKNSDVSGTPSSRRKRPKSRTDVELPAVGEEILQPKGEVCEEAPIASPATMLPGGEAQEERVVKTPDAGVQKISDTEVVTPVKPTSRKRKTKPEICQLSGGSDTTEEILYQRRTRSGRALGTPPPTPTRKANMRRKLVLEPLEEEN